MKGSTLERFAQEARIQLHKEVEARLNLVLNGDASINLIENNNAVKALRKRLEELKGDEYALVDEVAYTWFNRISALRFMDASGYNATLIVSPAEGKTLPEILSDALSGIIDKDVVKNVKDQDRIRGLVDGSIASNNAQAEIYRILLVASCNHLNNSLPLLFEKLEDYTDLLLPDDLLSSESIITKAVNAISVEDVQSVEVIGWLYQYYISEKKDEVFASFKKGKKAGKDEIPAATQLFTPEWIVRYLVENSLGRLWMLNHPDSALKTKMKYYIEPVDKETDFIRLSSPEEIKVLDPCCGSGHMLTYAFDLLFDIYTECGYTDNDAVKHIIEDNLYGIEIDGRAGQLAYFALMMKAREKSRRILKKGITPRICILQKVEFDEDELPNVLNLFENPTLTIMDLMNDFKDADILGSLITPSISNIPALRATLRKDSNNGNEFSYESTLSERVQAVLNQAEYLAGKYSIVITNPPYLAPSSADRILQNFAKGQYPNSKTDTGTMFIERSFKFAPHNGYVAMVTLHSWMFLSSFIDLRSEIINRRTIFTMIHIGARGFEKINGEVVSTTAFILSGEKGATWVHGQYFRLVEGQSEEEKTNTLSVAILNHDCEYYHEVTADMFEKIPGSPIAYWASERLFALFEKTAPLLSYLKPYQGLITGDNDRFLRRWYEISADKACYDADSTQTAFERRKKWVPYNKGGEYRKWYGNIDYIVNWDNDGYEIKHFFNKDGKLRSRPQNIRFYFRTCISWSRISSGPLSIRFIPPGTIFSDVGPSFFGNTDDNLYLMGLLNSSLANVFGAILSPTIHYEVGQVSLFPLILRPSPRISELVTSSTRISKQDWDSFEISRDFNRHPMLPIFWDDGYAYLLSNFYEMYKEQTNEMFFELKKNEEELNRIFIDIYGLKDELTPEESDLMVSVHRIYDNDADIPRVNDDSEKEQTKKKKKKWDYGLSKADVIKSFISYVVGCMFGRYDADKHGLAFAGGDFDISSYHGGYGIVPDSDNVIPILGDSWFRNDAETYLIKFVEKQFGHDTLNENIKFIENALGKSIREYFYKDFYNDHLKTYQKRPIYWMFSSPKGHFQALIYMHRYNENTANVVLDYLRQFRDKIRLQIKLAEESKDMKKIVEYENIDKDLNDYEVNILYPLAIQHLTFDLDDGVKVNYQKLGKALKPIK